MNASDMLEQALGRNGLQAQAGVPEGTPGAVQVVALCRHKIDGRLVYAGQSYWLPRERAEAPGNREIIHVMGSAELDWWKARGRVLSPFEGDPEITFARAPSPGSLRIVQGCGYDPGSAAYRFHSAVNAASKHASVFVRFADTNSHCSLRQLDGVRDAPLVREALLGADVLHCHVNYLLSANATSNLIRMGDTRSARPVHWREGQWLVRHYHGSRPDGGTNLEHAVDAHVRETTERYGGGLVRVGARLTLCAEPGADDLKWLPITVDVPRYRALRAEAMQSRAAGTPPFTISHSPTKRAYKGTDKLMRAVGRLQAKGLDVRVMLIEGKSHGDALRMKARSDACFDSFWLGIQGSGLEAGAMGIPVVAGDGDVAALYRQHVGHVPYTFAGDEDQLAHMIERLVVDKSFYAAEAERVRDYVTKYHDYPAVARRYEAILSDAMGRTDLATTDADRVVSHAPQSPDSPPPRRKRRKVA